MEMDTKYPMSTCRRWSVYLIGVLENILFGGVIYGWAQLTYLMKSEGVYFHLCDKNSTALIESDDTRADALVQLYYKGCPEQDRIYALMFTVACFCNTLPAGPFGYFIHHFGLVVTRLLAITLNVAGFLAVAFTTKECPNWLFAAMVLLALGNMLVRISSLQFAKLFRRNRSTAMSVISGSYTASAGVFLAVQVAVERGISRRDACIFLGGLTLFSVPSTILMPCHNIKDTQNEKNKQLPIEPLSNSLTSLSGVLQLYWISICLGTASLFSATFNSWITRISANEEEAYKYSALYSTMQLLCPLASFFPGMLTDYLSSHKGAEESFNGYSRNLRDLRCCVPSIFLVTAMVLGLQLCTFFTTAAAVYVAIFFQVILRASTSPVTSDFIRLRFPPEHFIRMTGLAEAGIVVVLSLQYPLFLWSQTSFSKATLTFMVLQFIGFLHPIHILSDRYMLKIFKQDC